MHTFTKRFTFAPLSKGRYRCNQTGAILTQKQILNYVYVYLKTGQAPVLKVSSGPKNSPPKKAQTNHPSKHRSKHR
jgi:hypothetical protein